MRTCPTDKAIALAPSMTLGDARRLDDTAVGDEESTAWGYGRSTAAASGR
jgi:hypothetical protein